MKNANTQKNNEAIKENKMNLSKILMMVGMLSVVILGTKVMHGNQQLESDELYAASLHAGSQQLAQNSVSR